MESSTPGKTNTRHKRDDEQQQHPAREPRWRRSSHVRRGAGASAGVWTRAAKPQEEPGRAVPGRRLAAQGPAVPHAVSLGSGQRLPDVSRTWEQGQAVSLTGDVYQISLAPDSE